MQAFYINRIHRVENNVREIKREGGREREKEKERGKS